MTDGRRTFDMMRLTKPILATMSGRSVLILDIGMAGALIEHFGDAAPGETFRLTFRWKAADVEYVVETGRTIVVRHAGDGRNLVSHTVVHFVEPVEGSQRRLQDLMATFVERVVAAQKANAAGDATDTTVILAELGGARRARNRGYVSYLLKEGKWWRVPGAQPQQPAGEGFTVAAHEDEEELDSLCHAYQEADSEGRQLIRRIAELSASSVTK